MFNDDVTWSLSRPVEQMSYFYRNGIADELYFIHEGSGVLHSVVGDLPYGPGDYILIPRGVTYQFELGEGPHRHLVIESFGQIETRSATATPTASSWSTRPTRSDIPPGGTRDKRREGRVQPY